MKAIITEIQIPKQRIADLLCSAFEGGSNYWAQIDGFVEPTGELFRSDEDRVWKAYDYPLSEGGGVCIIDIEEEDPNIKGWNLNLDSIRQGLKVMSEKYPWHFGNFLSENDDAETADVFLQCCLFGDIIYG